MGILEDGFASRHRDQLLTKETILEYKVGGSSGSGNGSGMNVNNPSSLDNPGVLQRVFSKDDNISEALLMKKQIEVEEDVIYFIYNSDGEIHNRVYDDKSDLNLGYCPKRGTTLKKMKTSFLGNESYLTSKDINNSVNKIEKINSEISPPPGMAN